MTGKRNLGARAGANGVGLIFQCREDYANNDGRFRGYVAECVGVSVGPTFHSPLCKLARAVIAADPATAEMPWQLVRNDKSALEGKRLANLAALDVSEEDGARFRKHRTPPAKTCHQNRRKPPFKGYLAVSGREVPETEDGAVCEMPQRGCA